MEAETNLAQKAEGSLSAISFPSGYCSAVRGMAGSLLMMVSTVPVMIPLMVRCSASTATTLYFSPLRLTFVSIRPNIPANGQFLPTRRPDDLALPRHREAGRRDGRVAYKPKVS